MGAGESQDLRRCLPLLEILVHPKLLLPLAPISVGERRLRDSSAYKRSEAQSGNREGVETQRLNLLADRFGARIQEWGQPRDRVRQGTVAGQAKQTFESCRWRLLPVSSLKAQI